MNVNQLDETEQLVLKVLEKSESAISCTEITKRMNMKKICEVKLLTQKLIDRREALIFHSPDSVKNRDLLEFIVKVKKELGTKVKVYYYPAVLETLQELKRMKLVESRELKRRGRADTIWYITIEGIKLIKS